MGRLAVYCLASYRPFFSVVLGGEAPPFIRRDETVTNKRQQQQGQAKGQGRLTKEEYR